MITNVFSLKSVEVTRIVQNFGSREVKCIWRFTINDQVLSASNFYPSQFAIETASPPMIFPVNGPKFSTAKVLCYMVKKPTLDHNS